MLLPLENVETPDPYGVGCANTQRFFNWQYERASMAVYGRPMPKHDPRAKARPLARSLILNAGAMLVMALLVTLPIICNDSWRFQRMRRSVRYTLMGVVLGVLFLFALLPSFSKNLSGLVFLPANLVQGLSWWLPDSLALVVVLSVVCPIAMYLLVQRIFLASEITTWGQSTQSTWEIGRKL
jgi:hypothetical protein